MHPVIESVLWTRLSLGVTLWFNNPEVKGFIAVPSIEEAIVLNQNKSGIFWTINAFENEKRRLATNVTKVLSWALDFDAGTKDEQAAWIRKLGIQPSLVVESGSGFHVYFDSINATIENFPRILNAMVDTTGADNGAKGLNRVLRVPGFYHWKNPDKPFLVKTLVKNDIQYHEEEMLRIFKKAIDAREKPKTSFSKKYNSFDGNAYWDRIKQINCQYALTRLSGSPHVNGEIYSFHGQHNGKTSVYVNGKAANVWIDSSGLIGSCDEAGPTIYQWLKWFRNDHKTIVSIIEDFFGVKP